VQRTLILALAVWLIGSTAGAQHDHSAHKPPQPPPPGTTVELSGLSVPDSELLDQDGQPIRFHRDLVAGKVVAMNFIFTTCTTICPPMGAIFAKLQEELGDQFGREVYLISISVDPTTDTPERLKAWSERFGAGPGWTLVTGPKAVVDDLLKSLQVFTPDFADHTPTVLVGNERTGVWKRAYGLAPAAKLAELIAEVASTGSATKETP
jgi:protein SCO1/2